MEPGASERPYRVNLPAFEGPLDLLLYLIKRDELDIWDIPIARITEEYLEYLDLMTELNLAVAGEFLLMASMLAAIKSRMLVAAQEMADDEPEIEDPRAPLVERLLEYQRYREAAERLQRAPCLNRDEFERGVPALDPALVDRSPALEVSLFDLMSALKEVLSRVQSREMTHHITSVRVSVVERIHWLHDLVRKRETLSFRRLFESLNSRVEIIITFLALLEMLKANIIRLSPREEMDRTPQSDKEKQDEDNARGPDCDWIIEERVSSDDSGTRAEPLQSASRCPNRKERAEDGSSQPMP